MARKKKKSADTDAAAAVPTLPAAEPSPVESSPSPIAQVDTGSEMDLDPEIEVEPSTPDMAPVVEFDANDPGGSAAEISGESMNEAPAESAELKLVPAEPDSDDDADETEEGSPEAPELIDPSAPEISTQQVIEAILFVSDTPLTLPRIVSLIGVGSARDVKKHIEALNQRYIKEGATFRIDKIAGGYQMLTLPQFNTWLRRLRQSRQDSRFSGAALETLSVVAYKQPVTRADIEAIRGVAAGEMLNRLRELGLVKIVGRAEDVGRPMLYGTTKRFLEVFGLASLDELPQVEQLQIAQ